MVKSFILSLVAIIAIAAICIVLSLRSILAGIFVSIFGIPMIVCIAIAGHFPTILDVFETKIVEEIPDC